MRSTLARIPIVGLLLVGGGLAFPTGYGLHAPSTIQSRAPNTERAEAVKEGFRHAWSGYKQYAFPDDELHPVTNTSSNSRNGWGASAVDALTTALVMELPDVVEDILDHIATINWRVTDSEVSLFETTIRYLGGLISGYDLLKGPLSALATNSTKVDILLTQAVSLADTLKFAFDTPTGIPYNGLNITAQQSTGGDSNGLATTGTLVLEWRRLSDLTGNEEYGLLAEKAESYLLSPQPSYNEPFPGLLGTDISITTGEFLNARGGWGGGTDSFYEYLIKMWVYDPTRYSKYKERWIAAADSSIEHLASHPTTRPDLTFMAGYNNQTLLLRSGHLDCFHGGNFLLGGAVLGEAKYTNFGLDLVAGCHETYIGDATQIGPEGFGWNESAVPAGQQDLFNEHGYYINTGSYDLRPEVIESFYYAYRMTGDTKYQDWAWDAFVAINATTRTASGFSNIGNVNVEGGGEKGDFQESFLFAELLKYSFLIHAADAPYQIPNDNSNEWVFNTEAHPFKVVS